MRTWSEKNGRADVTVYGFSRTDTLVVTLGGLIVLIGCIFSIAWLS